MATTTPETTPGEVDEKMAEPAYAGGERANTADRVAETTPKPSNQQLPRQPDTKSETCATCAELVCAAALVAVSSCEANGRRSPEVVGKPQSSPEMPSTVTACLCLSTGAAALAPTVAPTLALAPTLNGGSHRTAR